LTLNGMDTPYVPMRLEYLDPQTLKPNPLNPRSHPPMQRRALSDILDGVGMIQPVLLNERTGQLIDGHMRVEEYLERNQDQIPVIVVDLSEEEERQALFWLDRIGEMRNIDPQAEKLLQSSLENENGYVRRLLELAADPSEQLEDADRAKPQRFEDNLGVGLNPGERFDYVVLLFKTEVDWAAAEEHFMLESQYDPLNPYNETRVVRQGRVIDGGKYLNRILE